MHLITKRQKEMEGKPLEKNEEGLGEDINNVHMNLSVLKTHFVYCWLSMTVVLAAGLKNCWKLLGVFWNHGKHFFLKDNPTWFTLKNELSGVGLLSAMSFDLLIMYLKKNSALGIGSVMTRLAFFPGKKGTGLHLN